MGPGEQAHKSVVTEAVKLSGHHGARRGWFPERGFMASLLHLLPGWPGPSPVSACLRETHPWGPGAPATELAGTAMPGPPGTGPQEPKAQGRVRSCEAWAGL